MSTLMNRRHARLDASLRMADAAEHAHRRALEDGLGEDDPMVDELEQQRDSWRRRAARYQRALEAEDK